jgi:hypothetical protein
MARLALRGRLRMAILVYLLYSVLCMAPVELIDILFGGGGSGVYLLNLVDMGASGMAPDDSFFAALLPAPTEREARALTVAPLYTMLVSGPLFLGFSRFLLSFVRGDLCGPGMILDGFNNFFRAIGLFFQTMLFMFIRLLPLMALAAVLSSAFPLTAGSFDPIVVVVWSIWLLCFTAVSAMVALSYSQAFFLLADEPRHGLGFALKRSGWLMSGNKRKLFGLTLSFAGWIFVSLVVFFLLAIPLAHAKIPAASLLSRVLFSAVMSPAYMYMATAGAVFHDILMGRRKSETGTHSI